MNDDRWILGGPTGNHEIWGGELPEKKLDRFRNGKSSLL